MSAGAALPPFVCPACAGALEAAPERYRCPACARDYPVLFGIPDFRLRPDRYLSLEAEREKAGRLAAYARDHSFDELVAHYYAVTDDVPPALAGAYAAYVREAEARAALMLDDLEPFGPDDMILDLGCGAGGLEAAAAGRGLAVVGLDIALRWLVIARKRLDEAGRPAVLVCADAEAPPFPPGRFSRVVAADLLEHVEDPPALVAAAARQLRPGGALWLSAANRLWPGPHPSTRLWAAGYWPRRLRSALLRNLRGVDSLRAAGFVSPFGVARACRAAGLEVTSGAPLAVDPARLKARGGLLARAALLYARLSRTPGVRALLYAAGPAFQLVARKPARGPS
jgi:2-polyprenyl-3-methyl-5-hydroxy-6-metoxy-1,4-benzoquinol methylase